MPSVILIEAGEGQTWSLAPPDINLRATASFLEELEPESASGSARLLVSVFAASDISVLVEVLTIFREGVDIGTEARTRVPFSVSGCLGSSIAAAATWTFVVHPDRSMMSRVRDISSESLGRALQARLDEMATLSHPASTPRGKVWTLEEASGSGLFTAKSFHELRFGVPHNSWPETCFRLSNIASSLAKLLGEWNMPIAYLLFPFEWHGLPDGPLKPLGDQAQTMRWLRIAVGVPHGLTEPIELQLAARRLALENSAALCLYNPSSRASNMGERFDLVAVADEVKQRVGAGIKGSSEPPEGGSRSLGCVFAESRGRPGLVAHILSVFPEKARGLVGCSMTVLQGHTVAALVVPVDDVDGVSGAVAATLASEPGHRTAQLLNVPGSIHHPSPVAGTRIWRTLWVAWRVPDQPGVVASILGCLIERCCSEAYPSRGGIGECAKGDLSSQLRVDYVVSRVLVDGETCAGKMKLCFDPELFPDLSDSTDIVECIGSLLLAGQLEWSPSIAAWADEPVLLSDEEPAEEPWASLVLEGFAV